MSSAATPDRPVRFRDVFASGEFRALYAGSVLSWIGDYMARAAVTAMVYHDTQSEVATAAAFGDETGLLLTVRALASLWFTPNIALTVGYQYMLADVEDGDWKVDASLAGLYAGGTIRF